MLDPTKFTLLLLDAELSTGSSSLDIAAARFETTLPRLNVWRVTDAIGSQEDDLSDHGGKISGKHDGNDKLQLSRAYGKSRPAFYLIQPDGYVMLRGMPAAHLAEAAEFCKRWFKSSYEGSAITQVRA